ncbi:MAG: RluA family pseudouridine synthase [Bacteroidales bacterium OttesenSCG-928-I14]|jgi:23S rRNA pseudouridine1911/1915/1917 synthase|nr:RluA family pseudouridine synthase [Bacteroidales bacterium OttesenSCG-928-I14]
MKNESYKHIKVVVNKEDELLRVDKFLTNKIINVSRNYIQQMSNLGYILANNCPVKSSYKIKYRDEISIFIINTDESKDLKIIPENIPLNIIYEDSYIMAIDKPAGLVVHPGNGNYTGTLINAIAWHYMSTNDKTLSVLGSIDNRLGLVHRMDKNTSGLLIIAKNFNAKTNLSMQFFKKTAQRIYLALVWGDVKKEKGTIKCNIGRNIHNRVSMTTFPNKNYGKQAITHYRVLERFGYTTLIECKLETGRTHQIRVHMKYVGHILFNDKCYGGNKILKGNNNTKYKQFIQNCFIACPRHALHAVTLKFTHPKTYKKISLKSPLPNDIELLIKKWRNFSKKI